MSQYLCAENIMKRLHLRVSNKSEKQYLHDEKQEEHSKKEHNMKGKQSQEILRIIHTEKISSLY